MVARRQVDRRGCSSLLATVAAPVVCLCLIVDTVNDDRYCEYFEVNGIDNEGLGRSIPEKTRVARRAVLIGLGGSAFTKLTGRYENADKKDQNRKSWRNFDTDGEASRSNIGTATVVGARVVGNFKLDSVIADVRKQSVHGMNMKRIDCQRITPWLSGDSSCRVVPAAQKSMGVFRSEAPLITFEPHTKISSLKQYNPAKFLTLVEIREFHAISHVLCT